VAKAKDNNTLYKGGGVNRIRRIFPDDDLVTVELPFWDAVAQESVRLSGTSVRLYQVRRAKNRHPLYQEPTSEGGDFEYAGPWEVDAGLEWNQETDINTDGSIEGQQQESDAILWIARKDLEDIGAPDPKQGDVVELWNIEDFDYKPFGRRKFRHWDVKKAAQSGNIFTSEVFVMWRLEMVHKTRFDAARRIEETTT
jgi:hypothetical protein